MSAIDVKYAALGGVRSFLGQFTTSELDCPDHRGRFRHFQGGSIYWSPQTGAYEVHGMIRDKYAALGWERSFLGYPRTDETPTPDGRGRYNHFQGGSIYWSPQTGAYEVHGMIRDKYAALGWERSFLGYPRTDELGTPGPGRFSRFQYGGIYWTPYTGPRETRSPAYVISLDKFHIDNTRAWHEDTDHISFALKMGDQMVGEPLIRHTGDVNNGDHLVGLHFGPFSITNPALPVVFNYQILNSGHQNAEQLTAALNKGADALAASSLASGHWHVAAGIVMAKWALEIALANCDGPVAVDQIAVTGADLINWTAGYGTYSETRVYPGLDSAWGCGSNSRYTVTWSVIRL